MFKPEQILNYLIVEFGLSDEKKFDLSLLKHCRDVCEKCGLDIPDAINVQRALITELLNTPNIKGDVILSLFEAWIRKEYYAKNDEEKQFAIAVQNALREELQAKL